MPGVNRYSKYIDQCRADSITKIKIGDEIKLNEEVFEKLVKTFFAEIENKYS